MNHMKKYTDSKKKRIKGFLRKIPFLKIVNDKFIEELYYRLIPEITPEDKCFFLQRDICKNILIVDEGYVEVSFLIKEKSL